MTESGVPHKYQPAKVMRCGICGKWEQQGNHMTDLEPISDEEMQRFGIETNHGLTLDQAGANALLATRREA